MSFIPLLIVDEVGYIPFDPEAANLMSRGLQPLRTRLDDRHLNKPFSAWGEIFGDDMAATAMIDRLIHHAEILSLKGDSYRLRGKDLDARPARPPTSARPLPTGAQRRHLPPLAYGSLREKPALTDNRAGHFSTGASGPHFARP